MKRGVGNHLIMQHFDLRSIPSLDVCVLGALELFSTRKNKKIIIPYKRPLVVGSGNAQATGNIIFDSKDAVFSSESTFERKLKKIKEIDGVVLVSASGGKHAPLIAQISKSYKKPVSLITNNPHSLTRQILRFDQGDIEFVFPKQREPYTYNTSTYMGMILGHTGEKAKKIRDYIIRNTNNLSFPKFKRYDKFVFFIPKEFEGVNSMIRTKFIELFGRRIARDILTFEHAKHAATVVPSPNELFISFGKKNNLFGKSRFHVPLPSWAGYGAMMAIAYFVIGKIQEAHPPYFKDNIEKYCKEISQVFDEDIKPIVE